MTNLFRIALIFIFAFLLLLENSRNVGAFGPPEYQPDNQHPRIWLTTSKLAELKSKRAANDPDWQSLYNWCETNINVSGYDLPIGTSGLGNWPIGVEYRGSGWARHIINYALAYKVLSGGQQDKADQYAARAILLMNNMIRGMSVGEEENGLGIIRMTDYNDRTVNTAEAATLKEQNPNIAAMGSKNGYGIRNANLAIALGYDWLYEKLSVSEKKKFQNFLYRTIDWILGKRSVYNNGVLWKGVRYYEDTDGPCTGTTSVGETISCTTVGRTAGSPYQFAFAYNDMGDNFWSGYFLTTTLTAIATYGDSPDANSYLVQARETWWKNGLKQKWDDPLVYKGADPIEGWNYGGGWLRDIQALRALETATGEDIFSELTFPQEIVQSYITSTASNLQDMIPTGDWSSSNRGKLLKPHIFTVMSLLQDKNDPLAGVAKYYFDNATFHASGIILEWDKFLFTNTGNTTSSPVKSLPLSNINKGSGTVTMRSSWSNAPDTIFSAFLMKKDIEGSSHENYDAGHFYIQRGNDQLFADSVGHEALRHSVLHFGGSGPQARSEVGASIPAVPMAEDAGEYFYFKGDLTRAYVRDSSISWGLSAINRKASRYLKNIVYIRPNYWVVYDVTQSGPQAADFSKEWYSQYPVNGTTGLSVDAASNTITAKVGNSKAYVKTLYPVSVSFVQDTIPNATSYGRVKMRPDAIQEYDQFLHVIEATAASSTKMTPVERIQSAEGKMIGALIQDPAKPTIVLFGADKNGKNSPGNISYILPFRTSKPMTHIIVNLVPGRFYTVINPAENSTRQLYKLVVGKDVSKGSVYQVSKNGILFLQPTAVPKDNN